jgi:hypothetical protein
MLEMEVTGYWCITDSAGELTYTGGQQTYIKVVFARNAYK